MLVQKLLAMAQVTGNAVLYGLMALSVLSIGVAIDRWWFFRRRRVDVAALGADLLRRLTDGDVAGARKRLAADPSVEAEILASALDWYGQGADAVGEVLTGATRARRKKLDQGLLFLGTLGNNAPFIGLFGTVLGIVTAFHELGATTGGGSGAGAMGNVMAAIGEALVATAVGIMVAIPAVVFYNVFQKKSLDIEENVGSVGGLLLAHLRGREARPTLPPREDEASLAAGAPHSHKAVRGEAEA